MDTFSTMPISKNRSRTVVQRKGFIVFVLGCAALTMFSFSGCLVPPVCYPKTSVHGFVLDQDDVAIPNVDIETRQHPPRMIVFATPTIFDHIKADKNGKWHYSARKVGLLYVEAMPPAGYKAYWRQGDPCVRTLIGPFHDGDCPTNDFILRLEKLPSPEKGTK